MSANIEFKARLHSPESQAKSAEKIAGCPAQILLQRDTFFHTSNGRLKLREISGDATQLIHYFREDDPQARESDYVISEVNDPTMFVEAMDRAYGIRGIVRKLRRLWLVGQTRIHFDDVEGLGQFMEIEVVLEPEQSKVEGLEIARQLMEKLAVRDEDILADAYIDMQERSATPPADSTDCISEPAELQTT